MDQIQKLVRTLCRAIGTPRALAVDLLVSNGEWAQLQELRMRDPWTYPNAIAFKRDALVTELLRKCKLPSGVDTAAVAVKTFWECETQCCATNARLNRYLPEHLFLEDPEDGAIVQFIELWRKEIRAVLPKLPHHLTPRFSGGSTYADVGKLITIPDKMSSVPTSYQNSTDLLPFFWETSWGRVVRDRRQSPTVVRGSIFFTVPKDGSKDRGCAKEASIPLGLQLDAARTIRRGLLSIGIDLSTGKETHMRLARESSVNGNLATDDMSNASDTVARLVVKLGLPQDWYNLLDSLRARMTRVAGKWVRLEKFSSMGNGFTFELETLLFATLARVIVREEGGDPDQVRCFGDDLIYPREHVRSVHAALAFFGFTVNVRKSFSEGPFRESCGGDFFDGVPVRAHYIKELPDEPQQWIALANGLRRARAPLSAWRYCLEQVPSAVRRCRGPEVLGDAVIHDRPAFWFIKPGCEPHDIWVRAYTPIGYTVPLGHWTPDVVLASTTLGIPSTGVAPRDNTTGHRLSWIQLVTAGGRWLPT